MTKAMHWTRTLLFVAVLAVSTTARAQFGFGGGGGGATPEKIDAFLASAKIAADLVQKSAWYLASAVLSKDEVDKLMAQRKAIAAITDPKEKEAKQKELDKSLNDKLAKADYDKASAAEKNADDAQKKKKANGIFNFSLGVLQDADLILQGRGLVTGIPSPAIATKVAQVKDILGSLTDQADGMQKSVGGMKKLAASIDLKELPTKGSDKPKEVTEI